MRIDHPADMIRELQNDILDSTLTCRAHRNEVAWMQMNTIFQYYRAASLMGLIDQEVIEAFLLAVSPDGSLGPNAEAFRFGQKFRQTVTVWLGEDPNFFTVPTGETVAKLSTPRMIVKSLMQDVKISEQPITSYAVSAPETDEDGSVVQKIDFDNGVVRMRKLLTFTYDGWRVTMAEVAPSVCEVIEAEKIS
jgi:hypothetical protein